jgi:Vacuolar import and degradation protein
MMHVQVSLETGVLSGTITARNIPHQPGSVTTYFTGELIDMSHYNFMSPEHDTDDCMDWNHWNQFPAFCSMSRGRLTAMGNLTLQEVDASGYVFMRWKERSFVSKLHSRGQDARLTITGFYYCALSRATGKIMGSYCDPAKSQQGESTHFSQKLALKPSNQKSSGYSFGTVSFS